MDKKPHAEENIDKMAFVVESVSLAKQMVVSEGGIGEDLPITMYGWKNNELTIICQLTNEIMYGDKVERFKHLCNGASIMHKGWGVDEFTLVAEGYCSSSPVDTRSVSLEEAYPTNDKINECITFSHVNDGGIFIITKPYKLMWPRRVEYLDTMYYPGQSIVREKDSMILSMLSKVIDTDVVEAPEDLDTYYDELIDGLMEQGFLTQTF